MSDSLTRIVKPLEWEVLTPGFHRALSDVGEYSLISEGGAFIWELTCVGDQSNDLETAKAAAQADYERRILSALNLNALLAAAVREGMEIGAVIAESPNTPVFKDGWSDGQNGAAISAMMSVSRAIRGADETAIAEAVKRIKTPDR